MQVGVTLFERFNVAPIGVPEKRSVYLALHDLTAFVLGEPVEIPPGTTERSGAQCFVQA